MKINTGSDRETRDFAKNLTTKLPNGIVVCLLGDLGAGKTTFVRGVAEALHINEVVQSPTFNIMKIYLKGVRPLIHIDAYRLADVNSDIGLDEYIGYETGITVIEWPMFIEKLIPENCLNIEIINIGDNNREISIFSKDDSLMEKLQ